MLISGIRKGMMPRLTKLLRRRSAIEPEIGYRKADGRLARCPLKGTTGDALFVVLCACGHNIRKSPAHIRALLTLLIGAVLIAFPADHPQGRGVSVADIARKHEISAPQLHAWRRAARDGLLPMPDDEALEFLPVSVSGDAGDCPDNRPAPLTLEIGDIRILVPPTFDAPHLSRVIAAVRGGS